MDGGAGHPYLTHPGLFHFDEHPPISDMGILTDLPDIIDRRVWQVSRLQKSHPFFRCLLLEFNLQNGDEFFHILSSQRVCPEPGIFDSDPDD